jgi:hypothetical protein
MEVHFPSSRSAAGFIWVIAPALSVTITPSAIAASVT